MAYKNLRAEKPLTDKEIVEIAKNLGDVAQRLQSAESKAKATLYETLGVTVRYENATRTATVRSRPSHAYRWSTCPRSELRANDTLAVVQGHLDLKPTAAGSTLR
ncbi:hypothetical protein [Streptomyces fragilis]|uniref:Uncharacterized protein n=1 Tax=Streptomyces fragilis TaxID=67301 RepID=A0ABV2YKV5_9ACTN|nr:hypothetical protein [Streptomyces fragilis]